MSTKSSGPRSLSWWALRSSGMPSNDAGAVGASSTMATMRSRDATCGSARNAGRWPERAIPPSPSKAPTYTRSSGELRMQPRLALVRHDENQQHHVERADDEPAVRGGPVRHRGQREQQKPEDRKSG